MGSADDLEVESRPKERRGSASPPAVPRQARPQRAAAAHSLVQPPALDAVAAPAPDQLAAVLDSSALPPFLAAATAAGPTAAKFCVQCGTSESAGCCACRLWPAANPSWVPPASHCPAAVGRGAGAAPAGVLPQPAGCSSALAAVTPMWRSVNGLTYCNADGQWLSCAWLIGLCHCQVYAQLRCHAPLTLAAPLGLVAPMCRSAPEAQAGPVVRWPEGLERPQGLKRMPQQALLPDIKLKTQAPQCSRPRHNTRRTEFFSSTQTAHL